MKRLSRAPGFTLIELLVVILIIGVLIAISAPSFLGQTQKAHDSAAKQHLAVAYRAAKAYWASNEGSYTGFNAAALHQTEPALTGHDGATCPDDAVNQPDSDIFIATASGGDLTLCADPSGRVWTLTVQDNGPVHYELAGSSSGPTGLALSGDTPVAGGPANDNFSSAQALDGSAPQVIHGTLTGATVEQGGTIQEENADGCNTDDGSYDYNFGACDEATATVWYTFSPAESGRYTFDSEGSPAPFDGSSQGASPALEISDLNGQGDWNSMSDWSSFQIQWSNLPDNETALSAMDLTAGHTYLIRVTNAGVDWNTWEPVTPAEGDFTLNLSRVVYFTSSPGVVSGLDAVTQRASVGEPVVVAAGTWNPDATGVSYQWRSSSDGGTTWDPIAGATTDTYTPQPDDQDKLLSVQLQVTTAAGQGSSGFYVGNGTVTTAQTGPIVSNIQTTYAFPGSSGGVSGFSGDGSYLWLGVSSSSGYSQVESVPFAGGAAQPLDSSWTPTTVIPLNNPLSGSHQLPYQAYDFGQPGTPSNIFIGSGGSSSPQQLALDPNVWRLLGNTFRVLQPVSVEGATAQLTCAADSSTGLALDTFSSSGTLTRRMDPCDHRPISAVQSLSPDGNHIAYQSSVDNTSTMVANSDGSNEVLLTADPIINGVAFSPDSSKIAWIDYLDYSLHVANADGSGATTVSAGPVQRVFTWSPDSSKLLVEFGQQGVNDSLYAIAASGGAATQLTHFGSQGSVWSADWEGNFILFVANDGTGNVIVAVADESGNYTLLNQFDSIAAYSAFLSPDGTKAAWTYDTGSHFAIKTASISAR